jgi:hypothetical protein
MGTQRIPASKLFCTSSCCYSFVGSIEQNDIARITNGDESITATALDKDRIIPDRLFPVSAGYGPLGFCHVRDIANRAYSPSQARAPILRS